MKVKLLGNLKRNGQLYEAGQEVEMDLGSDELTALDGVVEVLKETKPAPKAKARKGKR